MVTGQFNKGNRPENKIRHLDMRLVMILLILSSIVVVNLISLDRIMQYCHPYILGRLPKRFNCKSFPSDYRLKFSECNIFVVYYLKHWPRHDKVSLIEFENFLTKNFCLDCLRLVKFSDVV